MSFFNQDEFKCNFGLTKKTPFDIKLKKTLFKLSSYYKKATATIKNNNRKETFDLEKHRIKYNETCEGSHTLYYDRILVNGIRYFKRLTKKITNV